MNFLKLFKSTPFIPRVVALTLVVITFINIYGCLNFNYPGEVGASSTEIFNITHSAVNSDDVIIALGGGEGSGSRQIRSESVPEAPEFNLVGLAGNSSIGAGLIAIDGGGPKLIKIGQEVANGWLLKGLEKRHVILFKDGVSLQVELPSLSK